MKIGSDVAAFDKNKLLDTLIGMSMEELHLELESKYVPWTYIFVEKISSIHHTMSWYAVHGGSNIPSFANRSAPRNIVKGRAVSQSQTQKSRSHANTNASARQKLNTDTSLQAEPSAKGRKSTPGAGSSESGLTHVDQQAGKSAEPILDYKKFEKVETDFWKECKGCYIFG